MQSEARRGYCLAILRQIREYLDISVEDVGAMFGTTGETVREWQAGTAEIPEKTVGQMIAAGNSLNQLLGLFRPERLPQVIRRRAEAFNGERALDWILDGRIADVAERYDQGLSYLKRTA
jgi:hypothetical protein